jgi:hypothetical protein
MKAKLAVKHRRGCRALEYERKGVWNTCWGPVPWRDLGEAFVTTERRYGKTGRRFVHWLVFMCNCTDCPGRLYVDTNAIQQWANTQLQVQP